MSNIRNVQLICIQLLEKFIEVCNDFDLEWFADSGTLLGIMRDGNLIPWDDDIDIAMPRKSYNILCSIGPHYFKDPYFFQTPETDNYFEVHAKIRMNNTTALTERECTGRHHKGIFIDIYPLDAIPDNRDIVIAETGMLRAIGRYSSVRFAGDRNKFCSVDEKAAFKTINQVLSDITNENKDSKYVANLVFYRYSDFIDLKFTRKAYSNYFLAKLPNCKYDIRIPIGYEEILTNSYNNWRIPQKTGAFHKAFYDCEHDYKDYERMTDDELNSLFNEKHEI